MTHLPTRQGQFARRLDGVPPDGLDAVRAGARRRRRRALSVGAAASAVVGGVVATLLLVPGGGPQPRAVLVVAPRTSAAASPSPPVSSSGPAFATPPGRVPSASTSPDAPPASASPTPSPTPSPTYPVHQADDIRPTLTGPAHAVVGQPVTFTLSVTWAAERPNDQYICGSVPGGDWACPSGAPCQQEGYRPAQPGQDSVQVTRTYDAPGTYGVMGYAGSSCGQYWSGENASYLTVTVTAGGSSASPSPSGTDSAPPSG